MASDVLDELTAPMPAPPVRQFSFTDFQVNNPTAPPPGDRLDAEFDRANNAIADTITWASVSLNTDGSIRDGLVGENNLVSGLFDDVAQGVIDDVQPLVDQALAASGAALASANGAATSASNSASSATLASNEATLAQGFATTAQTASTNAQNYAGTASSAAGNAANDANDAQGYAAQCDSYAVLAGAWAEHMPDTIPPNILAVMGISGSHWSARWWAEQAQQYVDEGMFAGPPGPMGPAGPAGIDGATGQTGPQGSPGSSGIIVGSFTFKTPEQLPVNGFLPVNWDSTGNPNKDFQFIPGQALVYSPVATADPRWGHLFTYVSTIEDPTGWVDVGAVRGPQGAAGVNGATGAQGPQGAPGARGAQGDPGPQGTTGAQGVAGPQGVKGDPGAQGATGAASTVPGPQGPAGPIGPQGVPGTTITPSALVPVMNGVAAVGTDTGFSRGDHRHPIDTSRLAKAGDTMSGALTLAGDPANPLEAATKHYVDAVTALLPNYLPLTGGALTGALTLAADPGTPLGAATKQYVDTHYLPLGGGTLTGPLTLAADPAVPLGAVTKQYVDTHYLPLTGGTVAGNLMVNGTAIVGGQLTTNSPIMNNSSVFYIGGNTAYYLQWRLSDNKWIFVSNGALVFSADASGNVTAPGNMYAAAFICAATDMIFYRSSAGYRTVQFTGNNTLQYNEASNDTILYVNGYPTMWARASDHLLFNNSGATGGYGAYVDVSSDMRGKMNVTPTSCGLPEIMRLTPIRFQRRRDGADSPFDVGFSAQELRDVIPEASRIAGIELPDGGGKLDDDEPSLGFVTTPIIAALVNAVKEISQRLRTLEGQPA